MYLASEQYCISPFLCVQHNVFSGIYIHTAGLLGDRYIVDGFVYCALQCVLLETKLILYDIAAILRTNVESSEGTPAEATVFQGQCESTTFPFLIVQTLNLYIRIYVKTGWLRSPIMLGISNTVS